MSKLTAEWKNLFGTGQKRQKKDDEKQKEQKKFKCSVCTKSFQTKAALVSHSKTHPRSKSQATLSFKKASSANSRSEEKEDAPYRNTRSRSRSQPRSPRNKKKQKRKSSTRHRLSNMKKWKIIQKFEKLKISHPKNYQQEFEEYFPKVSKSTLIDWLKKKNQIRNDALNPDRRIRYGKLSSSALARYKIGKFPNEENLLFEKICMRREDGRKVSSRWCKTQMKKLLREKKPNEFEKFKASNNWIYRFKRRFQLSLRSRTNMKSKSTEQRLPEIRKFHRTVLDFRQPPPQQDDKLGRFRALSTYHQDQVPLQLLGRQKTIEKIGAKRVQIKGPKVDLSKRQGTLQLCFNGEGPQDVNPGLIFRGKPFTNAKGQVNNHKPFNARIRKEFAQLRRKYPNVSIYIQKCAWMDISTALTWLDDFKEQATPDEKLLGLDNLGAHCHLSFKEKARKESNSLLIFTPEDCTDVVAVTDQGLGQKVKSRMRQKFDDDYDENPDRWEDGKVTIAERRALMVKWLSETWQELFSEGFQNTVSKAFKRCGMMNAIDGSEDHLIKLEGYNGQYSMHENEEEEDNQSSEESVETSEGDEPTEEPDDQDLESDEGLDETDDSDEEFEMNDENFAFGERRGDENSSEMEDDGSEMEDDASDSIADENKESDKNEEISKASKEEETPEELVERKETALQKKNLAQFRKKYKQAPVSEIEQMYDSISKESNGLIFISLFCLSRISSLTLSSMFRINLLKELFFHMRPKHIFRMNHEPVEGFTCKPLLSA
jgi:hypothetical protein